MGPTFEIVCQNALLSLLPKTCDVIGYSWHRDHELDVVGLGSDGTLAAGRFIHTTRQMTDGDLDDLEQIARAVHRRPDDRGEQTYHACCFCRPGLSDGLRSGAGE